MTWINQLVFPQIISNAYITRVKKEPQTFFLKFSVNNNHKRQYSVYFIINFFIIQQLFSFPCRRKKQTEQILIFREQAKTHVFCYNPVASFLKKKHIIKFCTLRNFNIKEMWKHSFKIQIGQDLSITQ